MVHLSGDVFFKKNLVIIGIETLLELVGIDLLEKRKRRKSYDASFHIQGACSFVRSFVCVCLYILVMFQS